MPSPFEEHFTTLFESEFPRLYRYLERLSGDPDLAADLAQESFVRLYRRGSMPDHPGPWLVTVAMNLFRNSRTMSARRGRLLTVARAEASMGDPPPVPDQPGSEEVQRVRLALEQLAQRDRELLLLRCEGYSYRELATALGLHEPSIGTLLLRAKRAFREAYGNVSAAS
jgi:RNA polymerase sigma factor (sigma-70 family)